MVKGQHTGDAWETGSEGGSGIAGWGPCAVGLEEEAWND